MFQNTICCTILSMFFSAVHDALWQPNTFLFMFFRSCTTYCGDHGTELVFKKVHIFFFSFPFFTHRNTQRFVFDRMRSVLYFVAYTIVFCKFPPHFEVLAKRNLISALQETKSVLASMLDFEPHPTKKNLRAWPSISAKKEFVNFPYKGTSTNLPAYREVGNQSGKRVAVLLIFFYLRTPS